MTGEHDHFEGELRRAVRARLVPPPRGFEDRLLAAVRDPVPVSEARSHGWLLATASFGMAVVVVAALLWTSPGLHERWQAATHLLTTTQRAPRPAPAAPPDPRSGAMFFYQRATASKVTVVGVPMTRITPVPGPIRKMDWTGTARGSLVAPAPATATVAVSASPDGHYVMAQIGDQEQVLDESGNLVSTWVDSIGEWTWADDGQHLCRLPRQSLAPALSPDVFQIGEVVPGHGITVTSVNLSAPVLPNATIGTGSGSYWQLLGCSLRSHRAVVAGSVGRGLPNKSEAFGVVDLSTGNITPLPLPPGHCIGAVMSSDGRYLALKETAQGTSSGPYSTTIIDLSSGGIVASQLPGAPAGFSWDDRLLVLTAGGLPGNGPASVMDWRARRAVWSDRSGSVESVRPLPGAGDLALTVVDPGTVKVVLVGADGGALTVAPGAELAAGSSLPPEQVAG